MKLKKNAKINTNLTVMRKKDQPEFDVCRKPAQIVVDHCQQQINPTIKPHHRFTLIINIHHWIELPHWTPRGFGPQERIFSCVLHRAYKNPLDLDKP
jgi:hypothetical protein